MAKLSDVEASGLLFQTWICPEEGLKNTRGLRNELWEVPGKAESEENEDICHHFYFFLI